jgi:hypothetical protein
LLLLTSFTLLPRVWNLRPDHLKLASASLGDADDAGGVMEISRQLNLSQPAMLVAATKLRGILLSQETAL